MSKRQMMGWGLAAWIVMISFAALAQGEEGFSVLFLRGDEVTRIALEAFPVLTGSVAYEGPSTASGEANWKEAHTYQGVSLRAIVLMIGWDRINNINKGLKTHIGRPGVSDFLKSMVQPEESRWAEHLNFRHFRHFILQAFLQTYFPAA